MVEEPYTISAPAGRLAEYVRAVWTLELPSAGGAPEQPIVPDGCAELIFNLGDPIRRLRSTGDGHDVHIRPQLAGQMTRAISLHPVGRVALVGVRLHPWAMQSFLGVGAREMREQIIPLGDAMHLSLRDVIDAIDPSLPVRAYAAALTVGLEAHVSRARVASPSAVTVYRALRDAQGASPHSSVRAVARGLGRSERQLQRVFEESVGISPKMYLRLERIQRTLRYAAIHGRESWSSIASACHFSDQSHLVKEMRRFAGCTPTDFDSHAGLITRSLVSGSS